MNFKIVDGFYKNVYLPYQRTEFLCKLIGEKYGELGKMSDVKYAVYSKQVLDRLGVLATQISQLSEFDETLPDDSHIKTIINFRAAGGIEWDDIAVLLGGNPREELKKYFKEMEVNSGS